MRTNVFVLSVSLLFIVCSCGNKQTAEAPVQDTAVVAVQCDQKIIHARVYLKPEKVADFIEAAKSMVDSSNMEAGCVSYQLFQSPYNNTEFVFVEVWKDQAAIDAHFNMSYFKAWGPKTADWTAKPSELKIFNASMQP